MSKQYFKYGEREYSMDDLLKLHAKFENSFYNFAKEQGGYDQEALKGLRQSVLNRINALKSGQAFEGDGVLIGDSPDNITIRRRALRKKNRYIDQDNTEWAKYYLNKLVEGMDPYVKEEVKPVTFDNTAHSLSAYLTGNGIDANSIFSQLDLQDPNDLNKARGNSQRRAELRKQLEAYKAYLKQQGIDFGADSNTFNDDYLSTIDTALNNFDNLSDYDLSVLLRKLGAGDAYTTAFTSNKYSLKEETEEEKTARLKKVEEEKKKVEEEKKKAEEELKQLHFKEAQDYFKNNKSYTLNLGRKSNYQSILDGDKQKYGDFDSYYSDIADSEFPTLYGNTDLRSKPGTSAPEIAQKWQTQFNNLTNTLLTNPESVDPKLASAVMEAVYENNPDAFIQLEGGVTYIPNTANDEGYAITYNPNNNTLYRSSLHELAQYNKTNQNIMNDYKRILNNRIKAQHNVDYSDPNEGYVFAEGGVLIPKNQYGGGITLDASKFGEYYKDRAQENDVDEKTQRARDRYINEDNKSTLNPEAGLTDAQIARVATAAMDLGSMVTSFVPMLGTVPSAVLGFGSTVVNFITDLGDDAVTSGQMWENLGMNLGMDVLGLIPGGGMASKTGKIIKNLKTVIPTLVAIPGIKSMLENSPEIAASWKKAFSENSENEDNRLNYQDIMNITQVLNVVAGGTNIGRNVYNTKKRTSKVQDKLAIDVNVHGTTDRKALILEGDDIKKFKEANNKGEAQKFIDELEGPNKYTINQTSEFNKGKFWGKDINDKFKLFNQNPFGNTKTGKANFLEVRYDNKTKQTYAKTGKFEGDISGENLINISDLRKYKHLQNNINKATSNLKVSMKNRFQDIKRVKKELNPEKIKLTELQNKLQGVPDQNTLQQNRTQLENDLINTQTNINNKKILISDLEKQLNKIKNDKNRKKEIKSLKGKIRGNKTSLLGWESLKGRQEKNINEIDTQLNLHSEIIPIQTKINKLNKILSGMQPTTHTHAYNKLQNMINNYNINRRTVQLDMNKILQDAGIKNAFKQGGNIQLFQKGGVKRYKNYDKTDKEECAEFSNNDLRKLGHLIYGNAWNLQNADLLYSGYNNNVRPRKWNLKDVEKYNADASDNFYKNFDSRTLDKEKQYAVNMYYKGSPSQETAYNDGRDGIAGTHTGYIQYNDDLNRWDLIHNIHRTVHVDPFTETQGSGKQYGVTAIFEPRKNTFINRVKDIFGFQNGGTIDEQNNNKDSIDKEQLIKYLKYAKR